MRALLLSAPVLVIAACAAPIQQAAICPAAQAAKAAAAAAAAPVPPPVPLVPAAPPPHAAAPVAAIAVAAPPPAPPPPAPPAAAPSAGPLAGLFASPGRLTLSNYSLELADVEALVTPYPDCAPHPGLAPLDFKLPLNSTWIVPAPVGSDVCWRQHAPPAANAAAPQWSDWNRAFTAGGSYVDSQL